MKRMAKSNLIHHPHGFESHVTPKPRGHHLRDHYHLDDHLAVYLVVLDVEMNGPWCWISRFECVDLLNSVGLSENAVTWGSLRGFNRV